jgi:flavin-dependent dehydrogenase
VAVCLRFAHAAAPRAADLRTVVESVPDGWWYYAPLPSGESVAVLTVGPGFYVEAGVGLAEQLERAPLTCARVGRAQLAASHVVHVSSSVRRAAAGPDWAAVGDAAAAYDPLSGFGVVKALQNALALAEALDASPAAAAFDGAELAAYAQHIRRTFAAYARQRRAYYALETRWSERAFWQERRADAEPSPATESAARR